MEICCHINIEIISDRSGCMASCQILGASLVFNLGGKNMGVAQNKE